MALANNRIMSELVLHEILSALLPTYREKRTKANAEEKAPNSKEPSPPGALAGTWKGIIKTYREDIPLTLSIAESGDVHAKLGSQLTTLLNDAKFDKERLQGRMSGDLGVEEDTGPERYHLDFYLYLRDGGFKGAAVIGPSPNLPFWVELKKQTDRNEHKP